MIKDRVSPHAARTSDAALLWHGREGGHAALEPQVSQLCLASLKKERKKSLPLSKTAETHSKRVEASDPGQHDRQTNDPITGER